jgi:hypothetical protein
MCQSSQPGIQERKLLIQHAQLNFAGFALKFSECGNVGVYPIVKPFGKKQALTRHERLCLALRSLGFKPILLTMAADSLPSQVVQFISRYVHSVEELEVLCLLAEEPLRSWTVSAVFQRIQSSEKSVAARLETFQKEGLTVLEADGSYRLAPVDANLIGTAKTVIEAYRDRRVSVIECIYKQPSDPIQDFADAFRLRKEK